MDIITIPSGYSEQLDLHHLQVFEVLLRERSLTRGARVLGVTQPALSKTLARLRRYFNDPLFVRVSLRMEPTPKALSLDAPVRAVLRVLLAHARRDPVSRAERHALEARLRPDVPRYMPGSEGAQLRIHLAGGIPALRQPELVALREGGFARLMRLHVNFSVMTPLFVSMISANFVSAANLSL